MPQSLILPINQCRVNAGYGSAKYLQTFGFAHYGVDLAAMDGTTDVRACADGEIIACGMDGNTEKERLGNVIVMILRDVRLPDGRITDLACRMFHLASIAVKAGQKVRQGEVVAQYGNTGAHTTGAHLHIEFDTDAAHPSHAFGIGGGGKIVLRGTVNSSLNPSKCWFLGAGQRVYTYPVWIEQG
ncbi:MAG: M23 family metallopeptidase, partial [Oscillospiraceae bacterium]